MPVVGLTPKVPLRIPSGAQYSMIQSYAGLVKQNFKNLILTAPGERVMDIEFGVGLRNFLFEMNSESTYDEIGARIAQQVERYMPFLEITGIRFLASNESVDNSMVTIKIRYDITPLDVEDLLSIDSIKTAAALF
mgnify:CR=1 FL=1|tara:strand:- start:14764 stop:15168 length:405 start_codon:yes stop_codon:yes gene_type:complete